MPRRQIDMVALRAFEHDGCEYAVGECFRVDPILAAKMHYQREATFAATAADPRRIYRRRDLVAER